MEKKNLKVLLSIFLVALVLRTGFILTLDNSVDVWGDWWDELGWKITSGQGFWVNNPYYSTGPVFYAWRPPGFPLFLSVVYFFSGHNFLAAKIALAILGSLSCIVVFLLAYEFFSNTKVASLTAFIYAFYPPGIFWTGYLSPVTLEIFLSLVIVYLFYLGGKGRKLKLFLLSGIVAGCGILTRSLFAVFLPAVFLWLLAVHGFKFSFKATILTIFACFLIVSPWVIRNYNIFGKPVFTSTEGGVVCYIANNEKSIYQPSGYWDPTGNINETIIKNVIGLSELEANTYFYKAAFKFIRENPLKYRRLVADRFFRFWKPAPHTFSGPGENYDFRHVIIALLTNLPVFILAGFGFLFSFRNLKYYLLIYLVVTLWSLPIILFFKTVIRYREPLMPFLIILAVTGIKGFYSLRKRK
ncbi:MAG: glycosyltransferase family 39 protein [Candidatus Omnitrophica bacterium]|nr:glycosyltransferase family 39 protein [Candidatus Omnitrophota bacterium]MCM8827698.1 glycosyltransferase family 39 protein [Candidatus Omnitrophota bacterium]